MLIDGIVHHVSHFFISVVTVYVTGKKHAAHERRRQLLNYICLQGQKISWFELPCVLTGVLSRSDLS